MPYIATRVSCGISPEQEKALKTEMGQLIALLPGKSEQWLMCDFTPDCHLYFQGKNDQKIAFVSVRVFGKSEGKYYEALTEGLTALLERELSIPARNIYVQYEECSVWGWNGHNF